MSRTIAFTPGEADYVSAARANYRCQLRTFDVWRRLLILAAAVGTLAAIVIWILSDDWLDGLVTGALAASCGLLAAPFGIALNYMLLPRRAGRLFRQQRPLHAEQSVTWDDSRLNWQGPGFVMDTPWRDYYRWHEAKGEFLLFLNEQMPQFIPFRALDADQLADLRATLVAYGPPRR